MSTLSLRTQGREQMKCILFSDSAVHMPPLSTEGLELSTACLNCHKCRLSSACSQTCFSLWHSVSGPSARDPCQPTCICAHFKYTRKELVELGSLLPFISESIWHCSHIWYLSMWILHQQKNNERVAGLGDSHRIQLPIFGFDFSETFLCSAFLRSMSQCLLICYQLPCKQSHHKKISSSKIHYKTFPYFNTMKHSNNIGYTQGHWESLSFQPLSMYW